MHVLTCCCTGGDGVTAGVALGVKVGIITGVALDAIIDVIAVSARST